MINNTVRFLNALFLKAGFTNRRGLLDGKTGMAMFFYHLSKKTNNVLFEEFAEELVDQITQNISVNTPIDFSTGLTGITWGLQYLVNNGFIESDNDVFEELDNEIFQLDRKTPKLKKNYNDFDGHLIYYHSKAKNDIWNEEVFNLLWTDLKQELIDNDAEKISSPEYALSQIWFLTEIRKKIFCPSDIDDVIALAKNYLSNNINIQWDSISYNYLKFLLRQLNIESVYQPSDFKTIDDIESSCKKALYNIIFDFKEIINFGYKNIVDNEVVWALMIGNNFYNQKFVKYAWLCWNDIYNIQPLIKEDTVFILNLNSRAAQYGIGTYLAELSNYYKRIGQNFIIIHLNDKRLEFSIEKFDDVICWFFPEAEIYSENYNSTVVFLIKFLIGNSNSFVFHLNYMSRELPKLLKKAIVCKIILVIHYFEWSFSLEGNMKKMKRLLEQHDKIDDSLEQSVLKCFDEEKKMMTQVDHVIGLTNYMEDILLNWYVIPPPKVSIINNGLTYFEDNTSKQMICEKYL